MKNRISATVDDDSIKIISKFIKSGKYRNGSHVIDRALKLLEETEK